MAPSWVHNAGLVWSTVPAHHQRYNEARQNVETFDADHKKLKADHSKHVADMASTAASLNKKHDSVLHAHHERLNERRLGIEHELNVREQSHRRSRRTVDHFDHGNIAQAWKSLFGEDLPPPELASGKWDDGQGQVYYLHADGRVATYGAYDGILIPGDQGPMI